MQYVIKRTKQSSDGLESPCAGAVIGWRGADEYGDESAWWRIDVEDLAAFVRQHGQIILQPTSEPCAVWWVPTEHQPEPVAFPLLLEIYDGWRE